MKLGFLFVGPNPVLLWYKKSEGKEEKKKKLLIFWLKMVPICFGWKFSPYNDDSQAASQRRKEEIITREGNHKNKTPRSAASLWGWENECVSCDALGCTTVGFLPHFRLSKIRGWSSGDVSSASDSAKAPVRHGMNSQISPGLTCKTVIASFVYLNYCFFLWVSTKPRVTGP